jgi:hypothetical protein
MAPRNYKSVLFQRNRAGLERAFLRQDSFHVCYTLLNVFITASTKLSYRNIQYATRFAAKLRENVEWQNSLENQSKIDRIDELLLRAKERLKRRQEKLERLEEAALPKAERKKKEPETVAPPTPTADPSELWARMLKGDTP